MKACIFFTVASFAVVLSIPLTDLEKSQKVENLTKSFCVALNMSQGGALKTCHETWLTYFWASFPIIKESEAIAYAQLCYNGGLTGDNMESCFQQIVSAMDKGWPFTEAVDFLYSVKKVNGIQKGKPVDYTPKFNYWKKHHWIESFNLSSCATDASMKVSLSQGHRVYSKIFAHSQVELLEIYETLIKHRMNGLPTCSCYELSAFVIIFNINKQSFKDETEFKFDVDTNYDPELRPIISMEEYISRTCLSGLKKTTWSKRELDIMVLDPQAMKNLTAGDKFRFLSEGEPLKMLWESSSKSKEKITLTSFNGWTFEKVVKLFYENAFTVVKPKLVTLIKNEKLTPDYYESVGKHVLKFPVKINNCVYKLLKVFINIKRGDFKTANEFPEDVIALTEKSETKSCLMIKYFLRSLTLSIKQYLGPPTSPSEPKASWPVEAIAKIVGIAASKKFDLLKAAHCIEKCFSYGKVKYEELSKTVPEKNIKIILTALYFKPALQLLRSYASLKT